MSFSLSFQCVGARIKGLTKNRYLCVLTKLVAKWLPAQLKEDSPLAMGGEGRVRGQLGQKVQRIPPVRSAIAPSWTSFCRSSVSC